MEWEEEVRTGGLFGLLVELPLLVLHLPRHQARKGQGRR
jgi:hypothetical protein